MPDLPWFVYAWPLLMVGVVAFAVLYKYLEVRQAAMWPQTTGKVVVSTSERRKVKTIDSDRKGSRGEEQRNFAKIVYEYEVSGQKLRNNRVTIGEDLVIATIGIFATFFGFNQLAEYMRQFMVNPKHTAIVVGLAAMGTVALLFGYALYKRGNEARGWPKVTGRVVRSQLDEFLGRLDPKDKLKTLYRPLISYSYEYNGISYGGDQQSLGAKVTSTSPGFAKKLIAKYPVGKTVEVYVNPQNASEAVLQPAPALAWVIWVAAAVLWGGAIFIARQP